MKRIGNSNQQAMDHMTGGSSRMWCKNRGLNTKECDQVVNYKQGGSERKGGHYAEGRWKLNTEGAEQRLKGSRSKR